MSPLQTRVRWRLKISVIGIVGSVLGAIGILVVLQQRGLVFPTTLVGIATILIGVGVGLVVPSLARLIAVRRINRVITRSGRKT